jgi:membrane protease YdiL (CAAX protease family)
MIPDREGEAPPPLTLEFAFMLAMIAPLAHMVCVLLLSLIGFRGAVPVIGMGAVLAYAGIFTLCALRFKRPPLEELSLVRAPASAWLAVLFLLASVVLSSEIDNWVKVFFPVPSEVVASGEVIEAPPFLGATLAVVELAVFPLAYELFFRGILQPLAVTRIGVVPGVLLTALFSAVASGMVFAGLWGVAPAFASSAVLGVLRQASGSLWPPLALHALTGAVTLGAQYHVFGLAGFDDTSAAHTPAAWVAGAAVLTAIGFALLLHASNSRDARGDPSPPPKT